MSIATAISRLVALRNRLRTKINSLGIDSDTQLDLDDCVGAVERIGGTQEITQASVQYNVADKQYARVTDSNLVPGNIVSGVSILGVAGTASVSPPSARLTQGVAIYGNEDVPASMYPPNGYDGFSSVVFRQDDIVGNRMLVSTNIKSGVMIMGVNGTYETPTETKAPTLAELDTDGITSHSVAVTPSSGKHLSQVTIPKITSAIDSNIAPGNIRSGVSILGVLGNYGPDIDGFVNGRTGNGSSTLEIPLPSGFLVGDWWVFVFVHADNVDTAQPVDISPPETTYFAASVRIAATGQSGGAEAFTYTLKHETISYNYTLHDGLYYLVLEGFSATLNHSYHVLSVREK